MAEQYGIMVSLIVKADSAQEAEDLAGTHVANALNEWMQEHRSWPFPAGTLLWWGVHTDYTRQLTVNDKVTSWGRQSGRRR